MSKQIEALKLALEALEHEAETGNDDAYRRERDVIREALADSALERMAENERELGLDYMETEQPAQQQEPVAWLSEGGDVSRSKLYMDEMGFKCEPLYKSPPQRKPLTDEEIDQLLPEIVSGGTFTVITYGRAVARAIEAAHGIKEKRND